MKHLNTEKLCQGCFQNPWENFAWEILPTGKNKSHGKFGNPMGNLWERGGKSLGNFIKEISHGKYFSEVLKPALSKTSLTNFKKLL